MNYNKPLFDIRCKICDHTTEVRKTFEEPFECPRCGGETRTLLTAFKKLEKAKDPYDYIDGYHPDPKPVKSFANDRRRGGKDTT